MTSEMKKQILNEYFDYNGKRYYWGTRFTMNYKNKEVTAQFNGRSEFGKVSVIIDKYPEYGFKNPTITLFKEDDFIAAIVRILPISWNDEMEAKKKYVKDSDMPEIVIGWILYVFIMCLLIIFKDAWLGWIAVTIFFFKWRHKKKEEEGVYFD